MDSWIALDIVVLGRMGQKRAEFLLVEGLLVSFFRGDGDLQ